MTVSSSTSKSRYTGNGVTVAFTGSFPILDQSHVKVTTTSLVGVETTATITTDYTVSGVGGATHTVTFLVAPAPGVIVTLSRNVPLTQGLDLVENDEMPSAELEKSYDKLTMIAQQIDEAGARSLRFPVSDSGSLSAQLPTAAARANLFLKFDASGQPDLFDIATLGAITLPVPLSDGGTGGTDAATARANLGLAALATKATVATADIDANAVDATKLFRGTTSGQVLTSNGPGVDPSYQDAPAGTPAFILLNAGVI